MTELLIAMGLIIGVVAAHEIGFQLGSLTRSADEPFDRQVGLVRTSTAALVAFLIGFAFSGPATPNGYHIAKATSLSATTSTFRLGWLCGRW